MRDVLGHSWHHGFCRVVYKTTIVVQGSTCVSVGPSSDGRSPGRDIVEIVEAKMEVIGLNLK